MMESKWKYTDPNVMPVPMKKLGDIVYTSCPWDGRNYHYISKCEIRKIQVRWCTDHWDIIYYLRTDIGEKGLQSSKQCGYYYEDGNERTIFDTPQEVIESNIARFIERVHTETDLIINTMRRLGYKEPVIIDKLCHLVYGIKETGNYEERALR